MSTNKDNNFDENSDCYIPLTNSSEKVLCSKEDYNDLMKYTWYKNGTYVKMTNEDWRIHRYIYINLMGKSLSDGMIVDHVNRNSLDNRRENLRMITNRQNAQNKSKSQKASSSFHGVCLVKKTQNYRARITDKGKVVSLGTFSTELEAATAYDLYLAHHPERETSNKLCHPMNFPDKIDIYLSMDKQKKLGKTSIYKGVHLSGNNFFSSICINGKKIHLLKSVSEIECAEAYDKYIISHKLEKKLNFPQKHPDFVPKKNILTKCTNINDSTVSIILTNMTEKESLMDIDDYDKLKIYKCTGTGNRVVISIDGQPKLLHRVIMNADDPNIYIDHINNDPFDNRKCNLRSSNSKLNSENKKKELNCSSNYIGVSIKRKNGNGCYWQCHIRDGKLRYVSSDKSEEHAARKRDLFILKNLPNSHRKLNFVWTNKDIEMWTNKLNKQT